MNELSVHHIEQNELNLLSDYKIFIGSVYNINRLSEIYKKLYNILLISYDLNIEDYVLKLTELLNKKYSEDAHRLYSKFTISYNEKFIKKYFFIFWDFDSRNRCRNTLLYKLENKLFDINIIRSEIKSFLIKEIAE